MKGENIMNIMAKVAVGVFVAGVATGIVGTLAVSEGAKKVAASETYRKAKEEAEKVAATVKEYAGRAQDYVHKTVEGFTAES